MRHKPKKIYFFLCLVFLFVTNSWAQCAWEGDVIIEDQDTTSISIFVTGAENNELSSNGLKAVTTHFKHEYIGDIIIELVSPSGQKVTLVGPSAPLSPITSLVTGWDVQFFANSLLAVPDSGYDPVWNSLQIWLGFTTYVGKYYPHQGSLEDFDEGSVNGIWTLNIIDQVQFGEGHFYCFGLNFCEDDGIVIETCSLVGHTIENEEIEACEGDPILELTVEPTFEEEEDPDSYSYSYLIFKDGQFHSIQSDLDMTTFDGGDYSICGIYYFSGDLSSLENIPLNISKEEVESYVLENGICASFSEDCINVIIHKIPEVITEEVSICFGDTLVINGISYYDEGMYEIFTSVAPCDSTSFLDLKVHKIDVFANGLVDSLSCDSPSTQLDGSMTEIPVDATIGWYTEGGNIVTNPDSLFIEVDRGGTYVFEVLYDGCAFSDEVEIIEADDFVTVSLSSNVLTCLLDSTFIDLSVSDTIDSITWMGPHEFSTLNEDIRVGQGGVYSVNFITNHGCEVSREIEILEDRVFSNLSILGDTISCTQSTALLRTSPEDTLGSTFQWFYEGGMLSTDTFQIVSDPGLYFVEVVTEEGCVDTLDFEVISEFREIDVELISDTIDCENTFVTLAYTSSIEDLNVLWEYEDVEISIDSSFNTTLEGNYNLSLRDSLGCSLDTSLIVVSDTIVPTVSIFNASFFCGDDSIQLSAQVNFDSLSYEWQGPGGVIFTKESPFISSPGLYVLEVCRSNGCCAIDSIEVGVDVTVPSLTFDYESLNCITDTVYIVPSDTSSYLLEWSLNGSSLEVDSNIIEVTDEGFYEVLVTDELNGCNSLYSFDIGNDIYDVLESLTSDVLNCVNTEVQIQVNSLKQFESFEWIGPGIMDNSLEPFVSVEGEYVINYTFTNGCSGSDTIEIIQEGELPNLQANDETITCLEEEVTLSVDYSSSSIAVNWTGPNGYDEAGVAVQASIPGIYTAIGIASGFCRDTIQVELIADTLSPVVSIAEDGEITCADSIVTITATTDINTASFMISGPDVSDPMDLIFDVATAGIYSIEAVGFNGCISSETVEVTQSTDFPVYTINLDSLTCDDTSVNVGFESPDSDLSVVWEGPIGINDDEYQFTTNQAGNYIFSLTNTNGCNLTDSFFVVMDTMPPNSMIELSSHINCLTDSVVLSLTNFDEEYAVTWDGPEIIDPSASEFTIGTVGEYSVIIESLNGCITEDQITVEYDTLSPEIEVLGDPINCSAGKTFLRVESDLSISQYNWTGPNDFNSENAEPLIFEEGVYYVEVSAQNGCTSSDSILVEDERVFPEIEVVDFYLPCDGSAEPIFTNAISEDASVRWFGPDNYFSEEDTAFVLIPGEYIGIAINEEGCTTSDTFQVIDEPVYAEFGGFSELLLCLGPVAITATDVEDDGSFYWNGPNNFFSEENPAMVEEPGIYQLVVTTKKGCVDSLAIEVVDGRIYPEAQASLNGLFQCEKLEVNLSGNGSSEGNIYTYNWSTEDGNIVQGESTLSPKINKEGTYIIEVKNNQIGCISYDTLIVALQEQDLEGVELEITQPTCLGFGNGVIDLVDIIGGYGPYTIFVDDNNYGERTNIQYLTSGEHLVSILDSLGCQIDTLVVIPEEGLLMVDLPVDTTLCFGDSILIQPEISLSADSISSIVWSFNIPCDGCTEIQLGPTQDMNITIEVTDINGCIAEDMFAIKVNRPNNLPFPQIFSPNGDDVNDIFYMPMTKGLANIKYIKIYDNWGGLLYFENDLKPGDSARGWNGTINGQNAASSVYIVEALVALEDGSEVVYIGDLTLIR